MTSPGKQRTPWVDVILAALFFPGICLLPSAGTEVEPIPNQQPGPKEDRLQ
jgi:hypothetical protein